MATEHPGSGGPAAVGLSADAEREWAELRAVIEVHLGEFWLGIVCVDDPMAEAVFRRRTQAVLRRDGVPLKIFAPHDADALRAIVPDLRTADDGAGRAVWLSAPRGGTADSDPWRVAWWMVLGALNELRDQLPQVAGRGLVLAGPPWLNLWARERAIDLWSVRTIVLRLNALRARAMPVGPGADPARSDIAALLPHRDEPASPAPQTCPELADLLRSAGRFTAEGRPGMARRALLDALDRRDELPARCTAQLLIALSDAEHAQDPAASLDHAVDAARLDVRLGLSRRVDLLERIATLSLDSPASDLGQAALQRAIGLVASQKEGGEAGSWARRLMILNGRLGRVAAQRQQPDTAYRESLDIRRRLHELVGDTPQTLRDLSVSLENVGRVAAQRQQLEAADTAYRESLDIARRLHELVGDTPDTLLVLSHMLRARASLLPPDDARALEEEARMLASANAKVTATPGPRPP